MEVAVVPETGLVQVTRGHDAIDTFDAEGRLVSEVRNGLALRRLPGNTVVERRSRPDPVGTCRRWTRTGGLVFLAGVYDRLRRSGDELARAAAAAAAWPLEVGPAEWGRRVLSWNARRLSEDGERFRSVYGSKGLLPPEPLDSVMLQAAVGCPVARACACCNPYAGRPFHVRTRAELGRHLGAVRGLLGASLRGRRWLFFGDADVLALATTTLTELLGEIAGAFTVAPAGLNGDRLRNWLTARPDGFAGFRGFIDERSGACKGHENFRQLRNCGWRRAYIALETGHEGLRRSLRKPGTVNDAVRTVAMLHAADIEVGVFVLLGIGGRALAATHLRHTADLLRRLELQRDDALYLSPLLAPRSSGVPGRQDQSDANDVTPGELAEQHLVLAHAVRPRNGPAVHVYHMAEHLY